jgi:hypothetical protein
MQNPDTLISLNLNVPVSMERVKDLLCCAFEGGSNYWCDTIDRMGGITREQAPYRQDVPFVEGGWLEIIEGEEDCGKARVIRLDLDAIKKGLAVFAEKYPDHFADFIAENDDATTGDVFLQCCCFGEAIYG